MFSKSKVPTKASRVSKALKDFELPPFRVATMEALRALRDPDLELSEVAGKVEADPGLILRILKTVNSAAFGLSRPVDTVEHAVAMMGRSRLESLILGLAVRDVLPREAAPGFEAARFWGAAARRASMARALAGRLHPATQAQSFTAALLQDLAVPVLASVHSDSYGDVLAEWNRAEERSLDDIEQEAFGWDHAEVGALMAGGWKLPEPLVAGIGAHHVGERETWSAEPAVELVAYLGEASEQSGLEQLKAAASERFGLDEEETQDLSDEAFERASELSKILR